jgi:hypothetical protein
MGGINGVDPYQYQQYALSNQFGMNVGGVPRIQGAPIDNDEFTVTDGNNKIKTGNGGVGLAMNSSGFVNGLGRTEKTREFIA